MAEYRMVFQDGGGITSTSSAASSISSSNNNNNNNNISSSTNISSSNSSMLGSRSAVSFQDVASSLWRLQSDGLIVVISGPLSANMASQYAQQCSQRKDLTEHCKLYLQVWGINIYYIASRLA
jgi:hypothetical protein